MNLVKYTLVLAVLGSFSSTAFGMEKKRPWQDELNIHATPKSQKIDQTAADFDDEAPALIMDDEYPTRMPEIDRSSNNNALPQNNPATQVTMPVGATTVQLANGLATFKQLMEDQFSQVHQTLKKVIEKLTTTEGRIQEMSAKIATIRAMQPQAHAYPLLPTPVLPKPAAASAFKPVVVRPGTFIVTAAEFAPGCQHIFYDKDTAAAILAKHAHNQKAIINWITNSIKQNQSTAFQLKRLSDKENMQLSNAYSSNNFATITNLIDLYCARNLMVNIFKNNRADLMSHCVAQGYNLNATIAADGQVTPLAYAIGLNQEKMVEILLGAGCDITTPISGEGRTFTYLHAACSDASPAIIDRLIKAGAPIDAVNSVGATPLIVAAKGGLSANVKTLIAAGADVNKKDNTGLTALDWAQKSKMPEDARTEIVNLLKNRMTQK